MSPQTLALLCLLLGVVLCQDRYSVGAAPNPGKIDVEPIIKMDMPKESMPLGFGDPVEVLGKAVLPGKIDVAPVPIISMDSMPLGSGSPVEVLGKAVLPDIIELVPVPIISKDSMPLSSGGPGSKAVLPDDKNPAVFWFNWRYRPW